MQMEGMRSPRSTAGWNNQLYRRVSRKRVDASRREQLLCRPGSTQNLQKDGNAGRYERDIVHEEHVLRQVLTLTVSKRLSKWIMRIHM